MRSNPALARFMAIGLPMLPRPMNPTRVAIVNSLHLHPAWHSVWRKAKHKLSQPATPVVARKRLVQDGRSRIPVHLLKRTRAKQGRSPDQTHGLVHHAKGRLHHKLMTSD